MNRRPSGSLLLSRAIPGFVQYKAAEGLSPPPCTVMSATKIVAGIFGKYEVAVDKQKGRGVCHLRFTDDIEDDDPTPVEILPVWYGANAPRLLGIGAGEVRRVVNVATPLGNQAVRQPYSAPRCGSKRMSNALINV